MIGSTSKMTVKVAFRVDACHKTGLGHLNRCLCLAHALAKAGAHCTFFCFASDEQLLSSIRLAGFELHLGHRYVDSGEPTTVDKLKSFAQKDLQIAKKVIGKLTFDWLIIDHYHLDKEWEEVFAGRFKVMVIDDLFDREHQCDVLVDTAIHDNPKRYDSLVPTYCNKLMSPSFALLHEKFGEIRNRQHFDIQRKRRKNNLLISVSGTDPHGWNLKILSRLGMHFELMTEWTFIVPILSSSPNLLALKDLAKSTKLNVIIIQDVADMATLIHECKIAIGAPGVSALERCCLGVPKIGRASCRERV